MFTTLYKTLSILCLSALMSSTLIARDIYVDAFATGAADGTNWGDAYPNMATAVADANGVPTADNIHVSAGHYVNFFSYIVTTPCTVRSNGSGPVTFESIAFARPIFEIDHTDIHFYDIEFRLSATHVHGHRSGVRFDRCKFTQASQTSVVGDHCTLMRFKDCIFSKNSSPGPGGAILSNNNRLVTIHDSVFRKNSSLDNGGAFHGTSNTVLGMIECHNTRFVNNQAALNGGAVSLTNTNATLINNVLSSNRAGQGGAIAFRNIAGLSTLNLINTTVFKNQAFNTGGVWRSNNLMGITRCHVANSIIYNNRSPFTPTLLQQLNQPPTYSSHSCIAGWGGFPWPGSAVIASAPILLPLGQPAPLSPCIDTGNAALCPVRYDITGSPRVVGPGIDMGAYEK